MIMPDVEASDGGCSGSPSIQSTNTICGPVSPLSYSLISSRRSKTSPDYGCFGASVQLCFEYRWLSVNIFRVSRRERLGGPFGRFLVLDFHEVFHGRCWKKEDVMWWTHSVEPALVRLQAASIIAAENSRIRAKNHRRSNDGIRTCVFQVHLQSNNIRSVNIGSIWSLVNLNPSRQIELGTRPDNTGFWDVHVRTLEMASADYTSEIAIHRFIGDALVYRFNL